MSKRFTYTIDEDYVVRMYDNTNPIEDGSPFLYQPHSPNTGVAFTSKEEATVFAESIIDGLLNPPVE